MISKKVVLVVLTVLLGFVESSVSSSATRYGSQVRNERRAYVLGAIKELQTRGNIILKAQEHVQAACLLIQQISSTDGTSTSVHCNGSDDAVRLEIDLANSALNKARWAIKADNFDLAERHLGDALASITRARDLLKI